MKTLVTGATGTVGTHVLRMLIERGEKPRAFVRDATKAMGAHGPDIELAVGDFGEPNSLSAALDGIEQVFLTCANHPQQVPWETAVIDAAAAAGVYRIVKLSALGARIDSPVAFFDAHGRIEQHLQSTGLASVLLQPAFKMSNLFAAADGVRHAGALFLPGAGAQIAMIDPRDIAEVAVTVLASGGHDGRSYQLTGPEAITFDEVARHLSTVVGRPIRFVAVPDEAASSQMRDTGMPEWFVANLLTQFRLLQQGTQAQTTGTVRELLGRQPRPVAEFLHDHAAAFA